MLSIVCTARDDGYGTHLDERMAGFFKSLAIGYTIFPHFELILVEYNPVNDVPSMYDKFLKKYEGVFPFKVVTVPSRCHPVGSKVPVLEFAGKNTGASFARDWILFTNPDTYHPVDLWTFWRDHLHTIPTDEYCRAVRADVRMTAETLKYESEESLMKNVFQLHTNHQTVKAHKIEYPTNHDVPFTNASGDFLLIHSSQFPGYLVSIYSYCHFDSELIIRISAYLKQRIIPMHVLHVDHDRPNLRGVLPIVDIPYMVPIDWQCDSPIVRESGPVTVLNKVPLDRHRPWRCV